MLANKRIFKGAKGEVKADKLKSASTPLLPRRHRLREDDRPARSGAAAERRRSSARQVVRSACAARRRSSKKIGRALAAEDKHKAGSYSVDLNRNSNLANNAVLGFGFDYCRHRPSPGSADDAGSAPPDRGGGAAALPGVPAQAERTRHRQPRRHLQRRICTRPGCRGRRRHRWRCAWRGTSGSSKATRRSCRSCARSRSRSTARAASSTAACRPATCRRSSPRPKRPRAASAAARIVGSGHVVLQAHIPTQPSFEVKAKLLAFNGPRKNGHKLILAQAYARKPPGAFVLTFRVSHRSGLFGTVMSTTLPTGAQNWAFLTHFDMTLHRIYDYRGERRSFSPPPARAGRFQHRALPVCPGHLRLCRWPELHDDGGAELFRGAIGTIVQYSSVKLDAYREAVIIKRT